MGRIVVGIDGSEHAQRALRWAADEARHHGHLLEAVTVSPPEVIPEASWAVPPPTSDILVAIKRVQAEALAAVDTDDLEVTEHRQVGFPAEVLLDHADGADLLVVGSRGLGRFKSALLGSVSRQLVTHASCPTAVIPEHAPAVERVLVGVDGSEHSLRALRWAHDEARGHGATLEVAAVHHWVAHTVGAPWMPLSLLPAEDVTRRHTQRLLDDAVERGTGADETVVRTLLEGPPAEALLGRAQDADLLVVGSRGMGGFERLLLGSVSARCIVHAPCPVVVIPGGRS